jgi:hypothetical protein
VIHHRLERNWHDDLYLVVGSSSGHDDLDGSGRDDHVPVDSLSAFDAARIVGSSTHQVFDATFDFAPNCRPSFV